MLNKVSHVSYVGQAGETTTLSAVLDLRAQTTPDDRFVTCKGDSLTFAQAVTRAERAGASLAALGIRKGDKVALMLPNCLEFLDIWFGCALLGAAVVPINVALKGDGLRYIVEHSDARVAIVDESAVEAFGAAVPEGVGPDRRYVRAVDGASSWETLDTLLAGGHAPLARQRLSPEDPASVLYTSGTTGPPKGVINCHNAYATAGYEFTQRFVRVRSDDVLYTSLPLFHVNAQMLTTVGSLVSGRPMVLAPRFSASGFFEDVRAHGATVFNYIGAMLTMLAKQPERPDDASGPARLAVGGAAPAELWPTFERRFGLTVLEIYGLTETATFCVGSPPDDIRVGKLGRPVSWADVKVVREDGSETDPSEPGEIVIRSRRPNILFKGYHKNPEATAAAMAGGWFHSGDRGRRDDDGYLEFIDRLKDCIRRRGENISSYEIERSVNSHPLVAESAAVGVPSDLGEEEVLIHVVLRPGSELDPAEITRYCSERMAAFMVPRYVRIRASLPKTATERVQKFALRDEGTTGAWDSLASSS